MSKKLEIKNYLSEDFNFRQERYVLDSNVVKRYYDDVIDDDFVCFVNVPYHMRFQGNATTSQKLQAFENLIATQKIVDYLNDNGYKTKYSSDGAKCLSRAIPDIDNFLSCFDKKKTIYIHSAIKAKTLNSIGLEIIFYKLRYFEDE